MKSEPLETTGKSPRANRLWRVRLFDGPALETVSGEEVRRFRSQKIGALLAYLALRLGRHCPREELYAAIWPEENDPQIVANRFRVALASLRRQLEPGGVPFGTVLDNSHIGCVCLRKETVWCDTLAFEQALQDGRQEEAAFLRRGTLLPGLYDDWVLLERSRLEMLGASHIPPSLAASRLAETDVPPREPEISSANQNSLPLYLTRFFGRENEIGQILHYLRHSRLVTLTGAGGMGKTRLAVEAAGRSGCGCAFASLASISDGVHIPEAILRGLGVLPSTQTDLPSQVIALLARRSPLLLILDNAEHLLPSAANLALDLLKAVPNLTLLVTSRQGLHISGETVLPLTPLQPPPTSLAPDDLKDNPAVALFLDRARHARPDFVLAPRNTEAIRQICLLLEGIPLALELAAARISMQTPAQIADALASSLLCLQSQQRGLSVRHRSLRAALQGSYDLLTPPLQAFFTRLSVFQGGWSGHAALFVTDCPYAEAYLEDLARRSLLVIEEEAATGRMRFRFLEVIRQFAAELLMASERETLELRHATYFLTLASHVTEDDVQTLLPLDSEQQNLLTALERGWKNRIAPFSAGLTGALTHAYIRGHNRAFLAWAECALTLRPDLPDLPERTRLGVALYLILGYVGRYESVRRLGEEMLREAEVSDFHAGRVLAKLILSYAAKQADDYEMVMRLSTEALEEARRENNRTLFYRTLRLTAWYWQEYAVNAPDLETDASTALLIKSRELSEECLELLPSCSTQLTFAKSLLASIHFKIGNEAQGYEHLKSAQQTAVAHGMPVMLIFCCQSECRAAMRNGYYEYAALLYGAFRTLCEKTGYDRADIVSAELPIPSALLDRLGRNRYETLAQRGAQIPVEELAAMSFHDLPLLSP